MDRLRLHGTAPAVAARCPLPATKTSPSAFSDIWELVGRWRRFLNFGDRKPLSGRVVSLSETERARFKGDVTLPMTTEFLFLKIKSH